MRLRLTPRDTTFFDLFSTLAGHLVTGADLLAQIVGADPSDRSDLVDRLNDAEHDADEATHQIMRRLNQTFVTPFDRDDIYTLASALMRSARRQSVSRNSRSSRLMRCRARRKTRGVRRLLCLRSAVSCPR